MSRCFPYPPPGYLVPIRGPLIESIKLQKDKEKAREERRKDKKERKDKKRKREIQPNQTLDGYGEEKLNKGNSQKLEKQISSLKGKLDQSQLDAESSDITEEHNQPVCVPKPSYSSENSQNSDKKRRRQSLANSIKADGSILKIRLSSFKKKEPNSNNEEAVGPSTSGRTDPVGQNVFEFGQKLVKEDPTTTSNITGIRVPLSIPLEKQPNLRFDEHAEVSYHGKAVLKPSTSTASKSTSKMSKTELLYKSLLESWVPSAQGSDDDDQDWLFQKKSKRIEKTETNSNAPCSLDSNLWPRAQFLPSVNVYALPYTIPF